MLVRKIFCPDCGVSRPASQAPGHGHLYECPGCRLLFIPAAEDIRWIEVAEERRPDELSYAEGRQPVDYRRPVRRFYRVDSPTILAGVFVSVIVLLTAAAGVFLIAFVGRGGPRPEAAAPVAAPPPAVAEAPEPPPDAPRPSAPATTSGPAVLASASEPWLGDWDADDQFLDGVGPSAVFSLSLRPGGALTLRCRSGTDLETAEGTWHLTSGGASPRLRLSAPDAAGRMRTADIALSIDGADRLRIAAAGGAAVPFRRR